MWKQEPDIALSEPSADEIKTTTCYMCACRCGIRVHLKDGRVRYIDGNRDHPVNKGVLCGKDSAGIMQHYSPSRLRAPLKRIGPRGSGEFAEISWDEALATATGRLKAVRGLRARGGGGEDRRPRRHQPPHRVRTGAGRVRAGGHARHSLDRLRRPPP
jgi:anaerobic selenocysteine-containing dehydrogenase